jgi:apolipoprotein D and lipocalin family protein
MKKLSALIFAFLTSCTGIPEGVTAADGFEVKRYLGTWHEITRFDHRFERGLKNISATYTLRDDGGINVLLTS